MFAACRYFKLLWHLKSLPPPLLHPVQKLCDGSYFGLYSKLLVYKFPQLWSLCQFDFAIAHNILDVVSPRHSLRPQTMVSTVVSPLPTFPICPISTDGPITYQLSPSPGWGGGVLAIIEISGKEINCGRSSPSIWMDMSPLFLTE